MEPRTKGLLGALAQQAKHDHKQYTPKARAAFLAPFERKVDPENKLEKVPQRDGRGSLSV